MLCRSDCRYCCFVQTANLSGEGGYSQLEIHGALQVNVRPSTASRQNLTSPDLSSSHLTNSRLCNRNHPSFHGNQFTRRLAILHQLHRRLQGYSFFLTVVRQEGTCLRNMQLAEAIRYVCVSIWPLGGGVIDKIPFLLFPLIDNPAVFILSRIKLSTSGRQLSKFGRQETPFSSPIVGIKSKCTSSWRGRRIIALSIGNFTAAL